MSENYIGFFIDRARDRGVNPPRQFIGALTKQIQQANAERQPADVVYDALERMIDTGSPPRHLPELIFEVACLPRQERRRRALISRFVDVYGWPTGARLVRGSHAASLVYDPLGTDKVHEVDWPYSKPHREEVSDLLLALDSLNEFLTSGR